MSMKTCSICGEEKLIAEYRELKPKDPFSFARYTWCKSCHRAKRRKYLKPKKPRGFAALPPEVREDIALMVKEGVKKVDIHKKYSEYMKYNALCRWIRQGDVS